jgi:hypothetical protein
MPWHPFLTKTYRGNKMILKPDQSVDALYPAEEGAGEKTTVQVAGTAASLANKYFIFSSSGVNYYAWFNLDAGGVDPAVASKTAVPVAITTGQSTSVIATAAAAAINALALVNSAADGSQIIIKSDAIGAITDAGAGNSGFTVSISQGKGAYGDYPAKLVDAYSNTPSSIS